MIQEFLSVENAVNLISNIPHFYVYIFSFSIFLTLVLINNIEIKRNNKIFKVLIFIISMGIIYTTISMNLNQHIKVFIGSKTIISIFKSRIRLIRCGILPMDIFRVSLLIILLLFKENEKGFRNIGKFIAIFILIASLIFKVNSSIVISLIILTNLRIVKDIGLFIFLMLEMFIFRSGTIFIILMFKIMKDKDYISIPKIYEISKWLKRSTLISEVTDIKYLLINFKCGLTREEMKEFCSFLKFNASNRDIIVINRSRIAIAYSEIMKEYCIDPMIIKRDIYSDMKTLEDKINSRLVHPIISSSGAIKKAIIIKSDNIKTRNISIDGGE